MLSLAVLICALLGANAEIPTWDASCVGCPLRSLADHKVESAGGFLATTLTVDVITLTMAPTPAKESDGAAVTLVGGVAAAIAVVALL